MALKHLSSVRKWIGHSTMLRILLGLSLVGVFSPLRQYTFNNLASFLEWTEQICFSIAHYNITHTRLMQDVTALKKRDVIEASETLFLRAQLEEYKAKEKLSSPVPPPFRFCLGRVFSVNRDGHTALVTIDPQEDVRPGNLVVNAQGVVGSIEHVGGKNIRIRLLTHKNFRLPVMGQHSKQHAIISGADEDNILLLLYRENFNPLLDKEPLVTSGYGALSPAGYPVATLIDESSCRSCVDLDTLEYVRIIIAPTQDAPETPSL